MSLAAPTPLPQPLPQQVTHSAMDQPKKPRGRPRKRRLDTADSFSSVSGTELSSSPLLSTNGAAPVSPATTPTKKRLATHLPSSPPLESSPPPRPCTPPYAKTNDTQRFYNVNPSLIYTSQAGDIPSSPTFASSSSIMSPQTPRTTGFSFSTLMASSPLYHGYFTSPAQNMSPGGCGLPKLSVKPLHPPVFRQEHSSEYPFKEYPVPSELPKPLEHSPVQLKLLEMKKRVSVNISLSGRASISVTEEAPNVPRSYYTDRDRDHVDNLFPELSPRQVVSGFDFVSDEEDHGECCSRTQCHHPMSDARVALKALMDSGRCVYPKTRPVRR